MGICKECKYLYTIFWIDPDFYCSKYDKKEEIKDYIKGHHTKLIRGLCKKHNNNGECIYYEPIPKPQPPEIYYVKKHWWSKEATVPKEKSTYIDDSGFPL